jgi:hypothetical protein
MKEATMKTVAVKSPMKLLSGLALGALVVATTAMYFSVSAGEEGSPHQPSTSRPLSNREMERLDYEADMLLFAEAHKPSAGRPLSNREIERLDYEADMLLFAEAHTPSASRPLSSEDLERLAALDEAQETQLDELSRKFIGIAAYSSKVTKAESEDLPQFLRTEIWLPGDASPVETRDLPEYLQSEVWLPGNTYPVFGR